MTHTPTGPDPTQPDPTQQLSWLMGHGLTQNLQFIFLKIYRHESLKVNMYHMNCL